MFKTLERKDAEWTSEETRTWEQTGSQLGITTSVRYPGLVWLAASQMSPGREGSRSRWLVVVLFGHSQGGLSWEVVAGEQSTVYGLSGVAKTGDGEDTTGGVGYCYIPQANASGLLQYQSAAAATAEGGGSAAANRRLARARPGSRVRAGVQGALALPLRPVLVRVPREPMDS